MIRFPSLTSDQHAYEFDSAHDWEVRRPAVSCACRMFDTLGDGMCAHSPAWPIPREKFVDYCYSLADYLVKNPQKYADCGMIKYEFMPDCYDERIAFAASIVYKDTSDKGKRQYYSLSEKKLSTADKLRYDKRFEEVPPWADGTPEAVYRLLWMECYSPLQNLGIAKRVDNWFHQHRDGYDSSDTYGKIGWGIEDCNERWEVQRAFHVVQGVIEALDTLRDTPRFIESYLYNWRNEQQRKAANSVPAEGVTQD